ncbi:winged helix-turn-helix domain-containing protein [Isoptericola cucumis]|nr:helix-turn-helix domain-containing protein [Isoptericola cucumis]
MAESTTPARTASRPASDTMVVRDPEALRAIAHPVRQSILVQLAAMGHARAADLAKAIDQPANSVSFHLRVLAKAGMIAEAPERARDKRDRVWTNVAKSYSVKPTGDEAADLILRPTLAWLSDVFAHDSCDDEATDDRSDETRDQADDGAAGDGPRDPGRTFMLSTILLAPDEAAELVRELGELLNRWGERSLAAARDDSAAPRELYQVLAAAAPRDDPAGNAGA